MNQFTQTQTLERSTEVNKVLRNTYFLLGLTLAFSSIVTAFAVMTQAPAVHWIVFLVGAYGLMFLTEKNRNSSLGLVFVFLFTGFMGYTLAPMISVYLAAGAGETVLTALGGTALAFFATSAFALTTKKDLSFLNGMIMTGFVVLIVAVIANIFLQMPAMSMMISCLFILFSSAVIMLTTQNIIRGGETNYISATVTLYVSIYNIFVSLLSLLGIGGGDD
ncbi:Bax inhibitor-1/YccA family protein [Motilimonas pumila]|uniref:Bax inhibitor-1/YccA family protein n=1 Tax=Motilimonas pumila TaxID=2303987 RepID=A0A418YGJ0_9GAMM|nr:Bax inhibitor-1/YccA family protein [Motilimonas pumila]RJG48741.1 Bax inhibitor-1/YccA family protein [Motilimonas pumila]